MIWGMRTSVQSGLMNFNIFFFSILLCCDKGFQSFSGITYTISKTNYDDALNLNRYTAVKVNGMGSYSLIFAMT